jgi:hypothetical protein
MTIATPVTALSDMAVKVAVKLVKLPGVVPVASPNEVPPAPYRVIRKGRFSQGAVIPVIVAVVVA